MLKEKKCVPCEGRIPSLTTKEVVHFMKELNEWTLDNGHLVKNFQFKDFKENINFVNKIAKLAEDEGHHPALFVNYNKLRIEIWTHAINGLSENDFILAAKIDSLS